MPAIIPVIKPPRCPKLSTLESELGPILRFNRIKVKVYATK
jgi:hypothetical protein